MMGLKQRAKTRQEVAGEYAITPRTLQRWLKKADIKPSRGRLTPFYLERIYTAFGKPDLDTKE